jgi:hypothetical protein
LAFGSRVAVPMNDGLAKKSGSGNCTQGISVKVFAPIRDLIDWFSSFKDL